LQIKIIFFTITIKIEDLSITPDNAVFKIKTKTDVNIITTETFNSKTEKKVNTLTMK
jgi:hypothetical protein